ncbi:MAG: thymidine kinase [Pseudomonadota bacterium]
MAKLYFIYAAMNAGKSTALLQSAFNYQERGMRTILLTPAIDQRGGEGLITSRLGIAEPAKVFTPDADLEAMIASASPEASQAAAIDCVLVDEAQFLTRAQVHALTRIVDIHAIPVMCYGLRTDFRGRLFEGSEALFALADQLKEMKSICHCGRKATMNLRINADGSAVTHGEKIEIGGNERYIPLCRKHFFERLEK